MDDLDNDKVEQQMKSLSVENLPKSTSDVTLNEVKGSSQVLNQVTDDIHPSFAAVIEPITMPIVTANDTLSDVTDQVPITSLDTEDDSRDSIPIAVLAPAAQDIPLSPMTETSLSHDSLSSLKEFDKTQRLQSPVITEVTMTDSVAAGAERLDPETGLPKTADNALTPPKFDPKLPTSHVEELTKVLKMDHASMTVQQKDALRAYLTDFYQFYANQVNYKANEKLHWNKNLLDLVFETIKADKFPSIDRVMSLLVILSRQFKSLGGTDGVEPRVGDTISTIRAHPNSSDTLKEGMRSLINYAEINGPAMLSAGLMDLLMNVFSSSLHDAPVMGVVMWFLRNLTVTDKNRKTIADRLGSTVANALSTHCADALVAEHGCYALGNMGLLPIEELGTLFNGIGTGTAVKSAMVAHATNVQVIEAACWCIYNATFDQLAMKAITRSGLEEQLVNAIRKHGQVNKNLHEWSEISIKRIRANLQANTPQAIADRNANRILKEGLLLIQGGLVKSTSKKYFSLLPSRLVMSSHDKDPEIAKEIKLKDIIEVSWSGTDKKSINLITRQKTFTVSTVDDTTIESWFEQLKSGWKNAVSAVTENPVTPGTEKPHTFPFNFAMPETIATADMEKVCMMVILHEINGHPNYAQAVFKCQATHPNISAADWFAISLVKRLWKEFLDSEDMKATKVEDKDFYELEKIKKHFAHLIDEILPKEMKDFDKDPKLDGVPSVLTRYEYCAKQGIRPTMEDRHIHIPYMDLLCDRVNKEEPVSYYSVYDGHGGINVADYVEKHLHVNVMKHPDFESDLPKALKETFMKTQDSLKEYVERLYLSNTAGSTGVVLVIKGKKLYCAWVGDSMATMYTKDKDVELVYPHKPGQDTEKARIEKLGGFVNDENGIMRVNGIVAVSRAFGNFRHKVIIPEADVKVFDLTGDEEYIVLACDGLWDVFTPAQVRKFVKKFMSKNGKRTKGISEALVVEALRLGSTDNVSVVFIEFYCWKGVKREF